MTKVEITFHECSDGIHAEARVFETDNATGNEKALAKGFHDVARSGFRSINDRAGQCAFHTPPAALVQAWVDAVTTNPPLSTKADKP